MSNGNSGIKANRTDLIVGGLFTPPAQSNVFNRQTQVGAAELVEHLFRRLVEKTTSKTSFDLHYALQ